MVTISLYGEKDYLRNCRVLDLECKPGNVHQATEYMLNWLGDTYAKITDQINGGMDRPTLMPESTEAPDPEQKPETSSLSSPAQP